MKFDIYVHGHLIAGSIMLGASCFLSYICFQRLYHLAKQQQRTTTTTTTSETNEHHPSLSSIAQEYCHLFLPEPSTTILKRFGFAIMFFVMLGYMILTISEVPLGKPLFSDSFHFTVYSFYFGTGLTFVLEGYQEVVGLPPDSSRLSIAFSLAMEAIMILIHSQLKPNSVEKLQHALLGLVGLFASISMCCSLCLRDYLTPYIFFLGLTIWQGCWWITIGLSYLSRIDGKQTLEYKNIPVQFTIIGCILFYVVIFLATLLNRQCRIATSATKQNNSNNNKNNSNNDNDNDNYHDNDECTNMLQQLMGDDNKDDCANPIL